MLGNGLRVRVIAEGLCCAGTHVISTAIMRVMRQRGEKVPIHDTEKISSLWRE